MRRVLPSVLLGLVFLQPCAAETPVVRLVDFETTVNAVSALRITNAIDDAEENGDALVLIRLDTPGGFVSATEKVVKRILASDVPVVVWVGPAGSRAASAGFFILISADVAAMAPGTRTGAASTIVMGGENQEGDVALKKMNEDAAAMIRSIAERRDRDIQASEEAVFAAKAYEESVALEKGLVDLIANDVDDLLAQIDGREVERFDGEKIVLATAGAEVVTSELNLWHSIMEVLGNPTVAYLLLLLGMLGLYVEFTNPGLVFPGVAGALCLLLFAFAAQVLPVSSIGILLILLAIVMFILEVKVVSYGMLTLGGLVSLVLGSMMLIDGPIPELRVPFGAVLPASIVIAALCAFAVRLAVRAHRARVETGVEGLAGAVGTVTRGLAPRGKVFVHGELWDAIAEGESIVEGTEVRVVRVDEMTLTVRPYESSDEGR